MIKYKCSQCGAVLESPDELGEKADTCPLCQTVCAVPLSKAQKAAEKRLRKEQQAEARRQEEEARRLRTEQAAAVT